ncbi:hypothetical protein bcgnr5378_04940 [Bacillus cereus]|uniref:Uncharacterized protein n=1 Tax=Bacillus cereus TaxID=1396 RepID=A0A162NWN6_BACCE|nr:hypothetical protein [Bacillus cereus]KZD55723.1 hypothetical protein B4088_5468 [Bacillus cereus]
MKNGNGSLKGRVNMTEKRINFLLASLQVRAKIVLRKNDADYLCLLEVAKTFLEEEGIEFVVKELENQTEIVKLPY